MLLICGAAGCVSMQGARGTTTILFVPVYDNAHPVMSGMGDNRSDVRWFGDPDSHPAVRPRPGARPPAQPNQPVSAGAQIEAPASGTRQAARDRCRLEPNGGTVLGALGGALVGSLFGGGDWRNVFIAIGAVGGALRGTEMAADGRRCV
jgi:hypothetical protein